MQQKNAAKRAVLIKRFQNTNVEIDINQ